MQSLTILIISLLFVAVPVQAKPFMTRQHPPSVASRQPVPERDTFSVAERNLIRAHLIGRQPEPKNLPSGLQRRTASGTPLPAGWKENVKPGHILDYHAYRRGEPLPESLVHRLPSPASGSEILRIDNKVVKLNSKTHIILDAFDLNRSR
jgi:Ni/Co efflux regulator RcnB